MGLKLPEPNKPHSPDWKIVDRFLDNLIEGLPSYVSKRQFRMALAKEMGYSVKYGLDSDENLVIKRLMLRAIRTEKVMSDPNRWQMLIVKKPQQEAVIH